MSQALKTSDKISLKGEWLNKTREAKCCRCAQQFTLFLNRLTNKNKKQIFSKQTQPKDWNVTGIVKNSYMQVL